MLDDRVPRIHRGGGFDINADELDFSFRRPASPCEQLPSIGMRLVRSLVD